MLLPIENENPGSFGKKGLGNEGLSVASGIFLQRNDLSHQGRWKISRRKLESGSRNCALCPISLHERDKVGSDRLATSVFRWVLLLSFLDEYSGSHWGEGGGVGVKPPRRGLAPCIPLN
jgi:hypothetical protein